MAGPALAEVVWHVAAASVTGTSHHATGKPCQDSYKVALMSECSVVVLVVADGAGSATRSDVGAALACEIVARELAEHIKRGTTPSHLTRSHVLDAVLLVQEEVRVKAQEMGEEERAFACTLLGAVLGPEGCAYFQIGDGAIVTRGMDDAEHGWVFWPDRGEYANETTFLTGATFREHLQFEAVDRPIAEALIFSDGIQSQVLQLGERRVHQPWFDGMMRVARGTGEAGFDARLSARLAAYLASPTITSQTDDDKTLVIAWARPTSRGGAEV